MVSEDLALDLRSTLVSVMPAEVGKRGYTHVDRYRDLNATFAGRASPEQAQRALYLILAATAIHRIDYSADVNDVFRGLGRREIGLKLLQWLTAEPTDSSAPERAQSKPERSID